MTDTTPNQPLLHRIVVLREGEGWPVTLAFLFHFLLFFAYFMLRPLRETMGIQDGTDELPNLFLFTAIATFALHPVFAWLVTILPREKFIPLVYRFFALNLVIYFALLMFTDGDLRRITGYTYFVWLSVFVMFAVSIFWGFMADLFRGEQAKRVFGVIGAGASVGGIVAPFAVDQYLTAFESARTEYILLAAAIVLECAVQCVRRLTRLSETSDCLSKEPRADERPRESIFREISNGVRLLISQPYLMGIALYILLMTFANTWFYFMQGDIVSDTIASENERTAWFARVDMWTNIVSLTIAGLVISRVMRWIGLGLTLVLLPLICISGFFAIALTPTLGVMAVVMVATRAGRYSIARPAREVLYTVVDREAKYKAKNFNDAVIYRFGDAISARVESLLTEVLKLTGVAFAAAVTPALVAWGGLGLVLGSAQARKARRQETEEEASRAFFVEPPTTDAAAAHGDVPDPEGDGGRK